VSAVVARIVVAVVLVAIAAIIAAVLDRRRRPAAPTQGRALVPHQLDRADFPRPDAPWLVVLWSSRTCESCQGLKEKIAPLESADVAVVDVEYQAEPALHKRYRIEAAPMTQVVDAHGVTQASFTGAFDATQLWSVLAELRAR
jgi:hypothetical protein